MAVLAGLAAIATFVLLQPWEGESATPDSQAPVSAPREASTAPARPEFRGTVGPSYLGSDFERENERLARFLFNHDGDVVSLKLSLAEGTKVEPEARSISLFEGDSLSGGAPCAEAQRYPECVGPHFNLKGSDLDYSLVYAHGYWRLDGIFKLTAVTTMQGGEIDLRAVPLVAQP